MNEDKIANAMDYMLWLIENKGTKGITRDEILSTFDTLLATLEAGGLVVNNNSTYHLTKGQK